MVGGPGGGKSVLTPCAQALEVLGIMQHWSVDRGRGVHHIPVDRDYLLAPLTDLADLIKWTSLT